MHVGAVVDRLRVILDRLNRPTDQMSSRHGLRLKSSERKEMRFYAQFIAPGDLVFDIGANIGKMTDVFLRVGARVVAVEPQESCLKVLRRRYERNARVSVVAKGAAEREGTRSLWICVNASTISTMSEKWKKGVKESGRFSSYRWPNKTSVPVTTLDELIQEYGLPTYCKIDVEGFEYDTLKGLSQPIPVISFEFTYPEYFEQAKACMSYLCSLGQAQFNLSLRESMSLALIDWATQDEIEKEIESLGNRLEFGDIYVRYAEVAM